MPDDRTQARAVRLDAYGDREVLNVVDVPVPRPAAGEVLVEVRAAGINPGEAAIRTGALHERFPTTFPSGQGSDLAGVVTALGDGVTDFAVGDEVLGYSWKRSSHATHAVVPVTQLTRKPEALSWAVAGSLYVAASTAWAAVEAIGPVEGRTVAVSAAAGGVGVITVQLLAVRGAHVLGIASPANAAWLRAHGATPVPYGDRLAADLAAAAPGGIDAFIDLFGPEYVRLAVDLGIAPERIETVISFEEAAKFGTHSAGSAEGSSREVLAEMAGLVASGRIEVPIAAAFPLERVRDAFAALEQRHTRGKIVLIPGLA
ncbi:NADP-dependent oxidoreductase [Streptomyces sp. 8L]|uniref:NADP-dependent oxidoreductase n=1 Tax=Streptomyces sp. 8L TaxID=2877242 RepID=UPI001CD23236|nr:NADP-dependent oxidoreductase [Streptomyces sp. 8L]MCA1217090.1 NADP-dependent oxidoreductase [Streptomyces sp. 8L]